jgi:ABC-type transport system involved in multi-copper enzyme maturation permease subunit
MSQILHLIIKDARRLRWAILVWTIVVAGTAALMVARPAIELQDYGLAIVASQLTSLVSLIELVMMILIVSWLVHEDPAAARDAFWLTRPINPRRLSVAKLLIAIAVLVFLPLLGQIAVMRFFSLSASDIARATPSIVLTQAAWAMALVATASLTPSITRYAVVLVGALATFVVLVSTTIAIAVLLVAEESQSVARPQVIDPLPTIVMTVIAIAASVALVVFQYRYRRTRWSAAIASAGVVVILAIPMAWPSHVRQLSDPDPGSWARDEQRVVAVVGQKAPNVSDEVSFRSRGDSKKRVAVPLRLSGLPSDVYVETVQARSRYEVGGATLVSTTAGMATLHRAEGPGDSPSSAFSAMQGALGTVRLIGSGARDEYESWPVVLTVTDQEFAQFAHTPGRLTSTIDFYLARATVAGAVPLELGQTLSGDRRRIDVVGIDRRAESCMVTLRMVSVGPAFHPRVLSTDEFVIRNVARGEAAVGASSRGFGSSSTSALDFVLGIALGGATHGGGNDPNAPGFSVTPLRSRFPAEDAATPPIDAAWLSGAELVRINTRYAGRLTRTLTIENFRMSQ